MFIPLFIQGAHLDGLNMKVLVNGRGLLSPLLYLSDLLICQQLGQGLVWSIAIMKITVMIVFWILGGCCLNHVEGTCYDDCRFNNEQEILVPLSTKVRRHVGAIWLSWLLEGTSLNPVCWVITVERSIEVTFMSITRLYNSFPYWWETVKVFELYGGCTIPLQKRRLDHHVCDIGETLITCPISCAYSLVF